MSDRQVIPDYQRSLLLTQQRTHWIVLGAAPGARAAYARIGDGVGTVITTNGGIEIEPRPHVYWCHDTKALRWWYRPAVAAAQAGTVVATSDRAISDVPPIAAVARLVFRLRRPFTTAWQPGRLRNPMASGAICAQLAVLHGATRITLVGMSGYSSRPGDPRVDYDDGRLGADGGVMNYYAPFMRSLIEQTPEIQWVSVGRPLWLPPEDSTRYFNLKEIDDG